MDTEITTPISRRKQQQQTITEPEVSVFDILKATASSTNEVLVPLTTENAKMLAKKDRLIAMLCEDYGLIPTFTTRKWDSGTTSTLVSNETVAAMLAAFTA